jgi:hypothetical protein
LPIEGGPGQWRQPDPAGLVALADEPDPGVAVCGELKVIAAILDRAVIERTLEHLGLPPRATPRAPARASMPHAA